MTPFGSCKNYESFSRIQIDDTISLLEYDNYSSVFDSDELNRFYLKFESVHAWISLILCCASVMANGFNIAVLTRRTMASTSNRLLIAVATCDSCLSISYFIFILHYKFFINCPSSMFTYSWAVFTLVHANLSVMFRANSLWLSVVIAGYRKRILSLNQPNQTESFLVAPIAIGLTLTFVSVLATPVFLGNTIRSEISPEDWECSNETALIYQVVPSDKLYMYDCFLMKINHFINAVLFKFLPLCLLTYYLMCAITFLVKRRKIQRNLFSTKKAIHQVGCSRITTTTNVHPTTLLLSAILLMTILCELPNGVTSALSIALSSEFFWVVYRNLGDVFDMLSLFNGLTTFLMYCIMSGSFRATFCDLFRCRNRPRNHAKYSLMNSKENVDNKILLAEVVQPKDITLGLNNGKDFVEPQNDVLEAIDVLTKFTTIVDVCDIIIERDNASGYDNCSFNEEIKL